MLRKRTSKSESVTLQYQSEIDNIYIMLRIHSIMKKGNRTYKEHVGLFNIYSGTDTYSTNYTTYPNPK
jgi:hypothetical protein